MDICKPNDFWFYNVVSPYALNRLLGSFCWHGRTFRTSTRCLQTQTWSQNANTITKNAEKLFSKWFNFSTFQAFYSMQTKLSWWIYASRTTFNSTMLFHPMLWIESLDPCVQTEELFVQVNDAYKLKLDLKTPTQSQKMKKN